MSLQPVLAKALHRHHWRGGRVCLDCGLTKGRLQRVVQDRLAAQAERERLRLAVERLETVYLTWNVDGNHREGDFLDRAAVLRLLEEPK